MNLLQIEEGFVSWLAAASQARALSRMALRDEIRDLVDLPDDGVPIHPKTVESWFRGTAMPSYSYLVALVTVLDELPPALAELCPGGTEPGEAAEDRLLDISDSDRAPASRPSPGPRPS